MVSATRTLWRDGSVTWGRVARGAGAWLVLAKTVVGLPLWPHKQRLRRAIVAGDILKTTLPLVRLESILRSNVCDDAVALSLSALVARPHNCSVYELVVLGVLTLMTRPSRAFEIGTYDGRSALAIAKNLPDDGTVYTLNLPPTINDGSGRDIPYDQRLATKVVSGHRWIGSDAESRITQVFGDSRSVALDQYGPCQLIFIDGSHEEDVVRSDSKRALEIIDRRDGVILWHDATRYGVRPALRRLAAEGHRIYLIEGTTLAVIRFRNGEQETLPY